MRLNLAMDFIIYFTVKYNEDKTKSSQMLWLNEAHFALTRNLISKNTAHLEDENSHGVRHRVYMKLKKQCGATSHSLTFWVRTFYLGSLFHRYKNVVYHKCSANKNVSELCNSWNKAVFNDIEWMQDDVATHIATSVRHASVEQMNLMYWKSTLMMEKSLNFAVLWPQRFFNHIAMKFCFWSYLKSYIVSKKFVRIERNHKTWSCKDSLCDALSALLSTVSRMQCIFL